jgi:hypothetical protein
MPARGPPSPITHPAKRLRQSSYDDQSPHSEEPSPADLAPDHASATSASASASVGRPSQSSSFRNVSACNRCRLRKNRCDQKLPSCASCAKAGVACVGYDPITKKEIPRSYVFYLETRVEQLEKLLTANNIVFPAAENLEPCSRPSADATGAAFAGGPKYAPQIDTGDNGSLQPQNQVLAKQPHQSPAMLNIVSPSKSRSLASASGVSFARVVFAAVQYSVSDQTGNGERPGSRQVAGNGTSMRDSFFGLHTKPTIQPAQFPEMEAGQRLVNLYFEHANPQIPTLHRGSFMRMFEQTYATPAHARGARELYMLNMVLPLAAASLLGSL